MKKKLVPSRFVTPIIAGIALIYALSASAQFSKYKTNTDLSAKKKSKSMEADQPSIRENL